MKSKEPKSIHFNSPFLAIPSVLGLELLTAAITYLTGGTQFVFPHFMYIPIILAAYWGNLRGAVAAAAIGGLLLGPWMPMDVAGNIAQTMYECVFRECIYMLIGVIVGLLFQLMKTNTSKQLRLSFLETKTGLPNLNQLRYEINSLTNGKKDFSIMAFYITNLLDINAYIDYSIGEKSILKAIEKLESTFGKQNVFVVSMDTYIVLFQGASLEHTDAIAEQAVSMLMEPILINNFTIRLEVRCGILNSPLYGNSTDALLDELKITLDKSKKYSQKIMVFSEKMVEQKKQKLEVITALHDAIQNDEFYMVYQPIIHIPSGEIRGAEGLLRWNHTNIHMGPGEFISIAEKAGFINEITKWVIRHSVQQIRAWQDAGMPAKIAVNVSSKDLSNDSVIAYAQECVETSRIDPQSLGFELTERVITQNETKIKTLLRQMQAIGIGISIDDFGTGYNSMIQLVTLPITYVKIDKFFIDHIEHEKYRIVITEIIRLAHNLKMEIIAEGVETEQQLRLLKEMGCDNIQGYYFSKPLPEKEYAEFVASYQENFMSRITE